MNPFNTRVTGTGLIDKVSQGGMKRVISNNEFMKLLNNNLPQLEARRQLSNELIPHFDLYSPPKFGGGAQQQK